jgi:hypothetical protein
MEEIPKSSDGLLAEKRSIGSLIKDAEEKEFRVPVSFEMSYKYIPTAEHSIIALGETQILSIGNIFTLIAPPGTGKSNIAEAIASNYINGDCDSFGFKVDLPEGKKILLCDTERTKNDCYKGFKRIMNRTGVEPAHLKDGLFEDLIFRAFIASESLEESRQDITDILETGEIGLMILDGVGDFVASVNDEEKAKEIVKWLVTMANKHNLGVMVTIHPNPKDPSYKPTGHLGSFLLKKSEAVMVVCKADNNSRLITTNFEHGKVRGGKDMLDTAIEWSDAEHMFMSSDVDQAKTNNKKGKKVDDLFKELFTAIKTSYTYGDLLEAVMKKRGVKKTAANSLIDDAENLNIIKEFRGSYSLNVADGDDEVPF